MTPVLFISYDLSERQRQYDDGERDNDDPKQIAIGNAACGKISLRLPGTLREFGEVCIVQLANGFVHLLVIEFGGLQRFLALVGRKQCSYSFFVSLTGLRRTSRVMAQIVQRNDVLVVLRPCRDSRGHEQSSESQQTHTPLEARVHSSSYYNWLGIRVVYELLCGMTRTSTTADDRFKLSKSYALTSKVEAHGISRRSPLSIRL